MHYEPQVRRHIRAHDILIALASQSLVAFQQEDSFARHDLRLHV